VVAAAAGRAALVIVVACSGRPHPEDAAHLVGRDAAVAPSPGSAVEPPAAPIALATGDLQVRVEWPHATVAARSSPGRTACRTARQPSVAPTTTWGIPEALVIVEGAARTPAAAHVTLTDCVPTPRLAAGRSLAITSAVDRPARLVLRRRGAFDQLAGSAPISVLLPIAGHTVTAALEPGNVYSLETDAAEPEVAFIAALPDAYVTEASGQVVVRDLAAGSHAVTAWLPPRGGQPARIGRGTATVMAGELAELTVTLAP
jgi:hypothetical protein